MGRRLGVAEGVVTTERRRRVIPSFRPTPKRTHWTKEMLGLLGRETNVAIAQRYGLRPKSVQLKRIALRIASQNKRAPIAPTGRLKALLRRSNREVLERSGLPRAMARVLRRRLGLPDPRTLRWPQRILRRLGKDSDNAIAAAIRVSPASVWRKRRLLGIRPWMEASKSWTSERCALLGKISDAELGRQMGISGVAVRLKRLRLGIAACPRVRARARG